MSSQSSHVVFRPSKVSRYANIEVWLEVSLRDTRAEVLITSFDKTLLKAPNHAKPGRYVGENFCQYAEVSA